MCWSRAFLYQVKAALTGCILADAALDTWAIGAAAPPAGEVYLCSASAEAHAGTGATSWSPLGESILSPVHPEKGEHVAKR